MSGSSSTDILDGATDKTMEMGLESESTVVYLVFKTSLEACSTSVVWSHSL